MYIKHDQGVSMAMWKSQTIPLSPSRDSADVFATQIRAEIAAPWSHKLQPLTKWEYIDVRENNNHCIFSIDLKKFKHNAVHLTAPRGARPMMINVVTTK